ncbi:MAG: ImmA/IrrE family metallo-endopeptidase [Bacteroidetes bacterium]|nr:ImmA/IrrE family metallo-endopeptidase [Bacteroidota bacterium]
MSRIQYSKLVVDAINGLNLVLGDQCIPEKYRAKSDQFKSFKLIRSACEHSGIFVILKNNLGSHHSKLTSELFRAFVISDEIALLMVLNRSNPHPAMSFSILHETVHLLLDQTGVSDIESTTPVEQFCNIVAGVWLLPQKFIKEQWGNRILGIPDAVSQISSQCNLSRMMVATRVYQERLISREDYSKLIDVFRDDWKKTQQEKQNSSQNQQQGCANYYVIQRNQSENRTLDFADRMIQSGGLTVTKAARILGVKPSNVLKLLDS